MSVSNEDLLERLIKGHDLEAPMVHELMERILSGVMPPAQIAASLVLLRAKNESALEISEAAQVVLDKATPIARPDIIFADVVGTGGDGHHTINVSTLASFTAASLGLPVAKHGNSSVSSKCGSADLLQEWQVNIDLSPEQSRACLDEHRWCFLFAPNYHPSFRSVKSLRQELRIRTIFNIIGPLVNPLTPPVMLVGVYDPQLLMPFALAFKNLGRRRVLIVHGSGLDEIALHGPTAAVLTDDRSIEELVLTPKTLGLKTFALSEVQGASPQKNAKVGLDILRGQADEAKTSMVAASAGVLLWLGEKASSFSEGVTAAKGALRSGKPANILDRVRRFGHGA